KPHGIAKLTKSDLTQKCVLIVKYERLAAGLNGILITFYNCGAGLMMTDREMVRIDRQERARRKANEIEGIRQWISLVEVVHSPDQSSFFVPPCAEVFDMKVSDRQYDWRGGSVLAQ